MQSEEEHIASFDINGHYYGGVDSKHDIFLITPEPELSEFEKVVKDRLWQTLEYSETFRKDENKWTRELATELLVVARNQLFEEQYSSDPRKTDLYKLGKSEALKDLQENLANNDIYRVPEWLREILVMSKENGKKEVLKDLPRWEFYRRGTEIDPFAVVRFKDGTIGRAKFATDDCYVLEVEDMLKLPGFKEE